MIEIDSDTLSGIAIVISIFGTIISLIYTNQSVRLTKRQFEADFYPRLSLDVQERSGGKSGLKTCLSFKLTNQSADRAATNVKLKASLSHPIWHWGLWTIKWYQFFEKSGFDIRPADVKETLPPSSGHHANDLENFLLESFPQLVYPEDDPKTLEEVAFTRPIDFVLHVHVEFQPPIVNAKKIKQDFYYKLIPQLRQQNRNPYCLSYWNIKLFKAS